MKPVGRIALFQATLPDHDDSPAHVGQVSQVPFVAVHVVCELLLPELRAGRG